MSVREGLAKAIEFFRQELVSSGEIIPTGPEAARPKPHNEDERR